MKTVLGYTLGEETETAFPLIGKIKGEWKIQEEKRRKSLEKRHYIPDTERYLYSKEIKMDVHSRPTSRVLVFSVRPVSKYVKA
jgi:hypothetical protein